MIRETCLADQRIGTWTPSWRTAAISNNSICRRNTRIKHYVLDAFSYDTRIRSTTWHGRVDYVLKNCTMPYNMNYAWMSD